MVAFFGMVKISGLVNEWANCSDGMADAEGDIWLENPQGGHWVDGDRIADFVGWFELTHAPLAEKRTNLRSS